VGSREVAVEQSPLQTTFVRSHTRFALSRPGADFLLIKYPQAVRFLGWCCSVAGWIVLPLGLLGLFTHPAASLLVLWSGIMLFMGIWLLGPCYRFDTGAAQLLTVRHFWRTRRLPLADILAVQVIDAGWFGSGSDESDGEAFASYQMNLILDNPNEPRLFVAYNYDLADLVTKAKLLADFLGVPLLEKIRLDT